MKAKNQRWLCVLAWVVLTLFSQRAAGQPQNETLVTPKPADVKTLEAFPAKVFLRGLDDSQQLILSGVAATRLYDLTADVHYVVANPSVLRVTSSGRIVPLSNGTTEIKAVFGDQAVTIPATATACDLNLPVNFGNQVVPIFTKLGCNAGGCHGKLGGQNGFALSLLGFDPPMDFNALVKEARGRRVLPTSPENSLLLLKASGQIAHGGGKRFDIDSDEYKIIKRWIAAGTPLGSSKDPVVTKISVFPEQRILPRKSRQQLTVLAHFSDGTVSDVTHSAQYVSNEEEIAIVDNTALVRTLDRSGEAGIMARYQSHVAVFRATVPLGIKIPDYQFQHKTVVDQHTHAKWKELGIVPSELCSDEQFLRRVSLDITGTLPTPTQVKKFMADKNPNKRDALIDKLLETPEYAYFFAGKWADLLRIKRRNQPGRAFGTFAFHDWIRESIAADKPYNQFAREILVATGGEADCPPTVWYKEITTPEQFADDVAQVFLGLRVACAQCHHHPYEKWGQDDYWGLAAFYGRIGRKNTQLQGGFNGQQAVMTTIFTKPNGATINKRTNKPAEFVPLDFGKSLKVAAHDDPRQFLADWMVDEKNPYFAKAVANRYWAHFFGRGIVDPLDDMRVTNPPSNPDLLDALAKDLVDHKYSLKHLIKTIVMSRTYQLSAVPNESNKHDKQSFARFYPRLMKAEVLYDAVNQVTNAPAAFNGLPKDKLGLNRAIMLPDESFPSYFLDVFGRPQRISACECERITEANMGQALHLLNSNEVQGKLSRPGGRADMLAKDKRPDGEKIDELFLWAFGRLPSLEHRQIALAQIERNTKDRRVGYQNIIWALINAKEFAFNQ